jgi:hypothetical protein
MNVTTHREKENVTMNACAVVEGFWISLLLIATHDYYEKIIDEGSAPCGIFFFDDFYA